MVRIFLQPPDTTAVDLRTLCPRTDPGYDLLYQLAEDTLGHLAGSPMALLYMATMLACGLVESEIARTVFAAHYPSVSMPNQELVASYFTANPPDIVLISILPTPQQRVWGYVKKEGDGDPALAERNEVFISRELTDALFEKNPILSDTDTETDVKRARIQLLWKTALMNDLQHSLSKYMFSPAYVTPLIVTPLTPDGRGNGENGDDFEVAYITFLVQAEWASKADASLAGSRSLWSIQRLLADQAGKTYELDDVRVRALVSTMSPTTQIVPQFDFADTEVAVLAPGAVCYRRVTHTKPQVPVASTRRRHRGQTGYYS
ncbi:hypothetical protein C8R46DRAFT_1304163 [Mycena filopes]|nr:hypothetical protein C8R46DRAFT_1304163 [Mycena filopes]